MGEGEGEGKIGREGERGRGGGGGGYKLLKAGKEGDYLPIHWGRTQWSVLKGVSPHC